jgi:lactate dehydrogenase-like 2-hydroxyacid dehydrogenase
MNNPDILLIGPYPDAEMERLAAAFVIHRLWEQDDPGAYLAEIGPRIRAIGTRGDLGADAALMARLPNLEIVACYGVGVDAIDVDYARGRGIRVTNTPEVLTDDVADMALALLLATARRIPFGDAHVRSGTWRDGPMPLTTSISGKRLGILGFGRVGRAVARRALGFGMEIAYCARRADPDVPWPWHGDAAALAAAVDFLVVCVSANPETRGIVDARVLRALGPRGMLVNVARGVVVDEPALLAALRDGTIAAAGLDVFCNEPEPDPGFLALPNVVLQPHNGSGTEETRAAIGALMRRNLHAHFTGAALPTPVC